MRWAEHVVQMGRRRRRRRRRRKHMFLMGKPEGKRPLGSPRRRGLDNIKTDLGEMGWGGLG
jgi:hypothetical protein